jgi:hypothetical protein
MTTVRSAPRQRRALGRARIKSAAKDLNHAVVDAGSRIVRSHPWALTSAGFCVGFALPFLFRKNASVEVDVDDGGSIGVVWRRARSVAVEAFACALALSVDHLIGRAAHELTDECED